MIAVGVIPVLVSRVSGDNILALDIIHVGSQTPYGAKYAVEARRKREKFWSYLTDNINNIREASSQTKHTYNKGVSTSKEVAT